MEGALDVELARKVSGLLNLHFCYRLFTFCLSKLTNSRFPCQSCHSVQPQEMLWDFSEDKNSVPAWLYPVILGGGSSSVSRLPTFKGLQKVKTLICQGFLDPSAPFLGFPHCIENLPGSYWDDIYPALESLIFKCLERDPATALRSRDLLDKVPLLLEKKPSLKITFDIYRVEDGLVEENIVFAKGRKRVNVEGYGKVFVEDGVSLIELGGGSDSAGTEEEVGNGDSVSGEDEDEEGDSTEGGSEEESDSDL